MSHGLNHPESMVGIVFISSTFYGLFLVLFALSALILHGQCKKVTLTRSSSTNIYLVFSYMMFTVLTTVWILSAVLCFHPNTAVPKFQNKLTLSPLIFSLFTVGTLANFIGDLVLAYRLYIIWDQQIIIIYIVAVIYFIGIALTLWLIVRYAQDQVIYMTIDIILAGMTISVNTVSTSLIAWQVWKRHKLTRAVGGGKMVVRLMTIMIESSALYTFWMLAYVILHFLNPYRSSQIFLYGSPYMAGIAAMLINVRVGLGWAVGEEGRSSHSFHNSAVSRSHLDHDSQANDT